MAQRVDHGRRGTVDRHLAHALGSVWTMRVRTLEHHDVDRRRVHWCGDDVVGQLRVGHAAVTHHHLLEQREANALRGATLDLAFGHDRMNRLANLGHDGHVSRRHLERHGVYLKLDDVAGPGVTAVGITGIALVVPHLSGWRLILRGHGQRTVTREVRGRRLVTEGLAHVTSTALEQLADNHAGARGDGRAAIGHPIGVGLMHVDGVVGQGERIRDNLRQHGPRALPDLRARHQDACAGRRQLQRRFRRQLHFTGTGETGSVKE